jgi:hypothetical protein
MARPDEDQFGAVLYLEGRSRQSSWRGAAMALQKLRSLNGRGAIR